MNRSYSKIRHIQESNRILESRKINEQGATLIQIGKTLADPSNSGLDLPSNDTPFGDVTYKDVQVKYCAEERDLTGKYAVISNFAKNLSIAPENIVDTLSYIGDNWDKQGDKILPYIFTRQSGKLQINTWGKLKALVKEPHVFPTGDNFWDYVTKNDRSPNVIAALKLIEQIFRPTVKKNGEEDPFCKTYKWRWEKKVEGGLI